MKWESSNSSTDQQEYILWHQDKKLLTLNFHPATNAVRIESAKEKRVFQIRKEGFLKNRTVIRNEYGVLMGQLGNENKEQYIEMEHEKFFYFTRKRQQSEIVIYKESKDDPFIVCSLNIDSTNLSKNKTLPANLESGLLLSLCWYLMMPKVKERETALAV